ncbi:DUF445 domain-containing protein [Bacillus sp. T33-2]|uniref:DUF445 domain-containing protein n=1 Tax=Bacillus sp. T33-2 TaxID=2054168 RepID=UPI000C78384E|nr:DUF445 domain-containing protein [Bacillus sp. T33-2]PLR96779.1 DUF445 domain-containing protein [Bacillus sp. T33-2]
MSKNSRHLASISLAVMGTGFAATLPFHGPLPVTLLHGGFEAGIVGGLADWFAVTALFRHPMGIPIPHTALLPKNRKKMTRAVVSTIENEWLSKESIQDKIKQVKFTEKLLPVVEKEMHSDAVKKGFESAIKQLITHADIEKIVPVIEKQIRNYIGSYRIDPLLQSVIDQLLEREYDEKGLEFALAKAEEWVLKEERVFQLGSFAVRAINKIELDGFLQIALKSFQNLVNEEKLGKILQNLLYSNIASLRSPSNPDRQALLGHIRKGLISVKDNTQLLDDINNLKADLFAGWDPSGEINHALQELRGKLLTFVEDGKLMETYIMPYLQGVLSNIKEDAERIDQIESWLQKQFTSLIEANHSKIGRLVQENLEKLDDETLIEMIENNFGRDLQWIRVNGAVCGFFIGVVITAIQSLF